MSNLFRNFTTSLDGIDVNYIVEDNNEENEEVDDEGSIFFQLDVSEGLSLFFKVNSTQLYEQED